MPFTLLVRGLRTLQNWPRLVVILHILMGIVMIWPISQMNWRLGLADLLSKEHPARQATEAVEQKFGGFGKLSVIAHSSDSLQNSRVLEQLAQSLESDSLVNFTERLTEAPFFRKHQLLYIRKYDLLDIQQRLDQKIREQKLAPNPLWVDLDSSLPAPNSPPLNLADLEAKYLGRLNPLLGNADGSIQLLDIYPAYPLKELENNRTLVKHVQQQLLKINAQNSIPIALTGQVYLSAQAGRTLLQEVRKIGWISAGIILMFLVIWFFRQPQIPLLAIIPLSLSLVWSLGIHALLFGDMNLFTVILTLIIPGLAVDQLTHFLSHYADERRRGLGPDLALESTVLGLGPVISVVTLISIASFLSLTLMPLGGLREMGITGAVGVLANWVSIVLFLPILITLFQRRGNFRIFGSSRPTIDSSKPQQLLIWKKLIPPLLMATLLLISKGIIPSFEYSFHAMQSSQPTAQGDSLLRLAGIPIQEPAVIISPNAQKAAELVKALQQQSALDTSRTIGRIVGITSLLPADQEEKLQILKNLRQTLTPELIQQFHGQDSSALQRILMSYNPTPVSVPDLPPNILRKFLVQDSSLGQFTFVFPAIDLDDGRDCRRFAKELSSIRLPDGSHPQATGTAILRAGVLNQSLPWMNQSLWATVLALLFILWLYVQKPLHLFFVIMPPAIGFLWLLGILRIFDIHLNAFSAQIFPLLIGISISGSLHLWYQYREKSTGSVLAVLRHTAPTALASTIAVSVCFSGLLFSSHPGLRSLGLVAVSGLLLLWIAQISLFPVMVGWLDWRRYQQEQKRNSP